MIYSPKTRRWLAVSFTVAVATVASLSLIEDPVRARVAILGFAVLSLWLSEVVPPYVATLALLAGIPLTLGGSDPRYSLGSALAWSADPVLALFFGGFTFGVAASRYRVDQLIAERLLKLAGGRRRSLLALVMAATAILSMWISNVAAAAMMLSVVRPYVHREERTDPLRRSLLLGVAMAANIGGIATPIGTGPNGIAIANLTPWVRITFVQWMSFALPLMIGMLALIYVLIQRGHRIEGTFVSPELRVEKLPVRARGLILVFGLTVLAWLFEPLHGIPAPVVALASASVIFAGWLDPKDLDRIDWSTLFLIAGGLLFARLLESSGMFDLITAGFRWDSAPAALSTVALVLCAAMMSAVMSNTASAALLIPLALTLGPPHSIAILIAVGTSFGVPFTISTPPNAMAYGEGGLNSRDLLRVGLPIMLIGCLLVGLTGPTILRWIGLP